MYEAQGRRRSSATARRAFGSSAAELRPRLRLRLELMRTVFYSMSMSLDGYVNGPDGSFDWGAPDEELHQFHNDRVRTQTRQVCGRNLYEIMRYWETPQDDWGPIEHDFAGVWNPLSKIVVSSTLTDA